MALQFDLSSLGLGGGGGVDLNDALSATTPQNRSVFSKPFGDKTVWKTNDHGGSVRVVFLFDPNKSWDANHIMASITPDWGSAMRHELAKKLLPPELVVVDGTPDRNKQRWQMLRANLPSKVLERYLLDDPAKLKFFVRMIEVCFSCRALKDRQQTDRGKESAARHVFCSLVRALLLRDGCWLLPCRPACAWSAG